MIVQQKLALSIITITLNNERTLEKVLNAVSAWADEIILVDSGSTDETLAIAQRFGCKIFHRSFDGFGPQKKFAVNQAKNDWVMVVDADEILTSEIKSEIFQKLTNNKKSANVHGYRVPISLVFMGKLMRYGSEYKMYHLRLFNKNFGYYNLKLVHEDVVLDGKIENLENHVLHESYADLQDYITKFNRYTSAAANDLYNNGKKTSILNIIIKFPFTFIKVYFLRLNLLNGYPGFLWALLSACYPVVKYAKLKEKYDAFQIIR